MEPTIYLSTLSQFLKEYFLLLTKLFSTNEQYRRQEKSTEFSTRKTR